MPLSKIQREALRLLAAHRNPESAALEEAESFVRLMPAGKEGLVFLKNGAVVEPDPAQLEACTEHSGSRGGHWPCRTLALVIRNHERYAGSISVILYSSFRLIARRVCASPT